MSESTTTEQEQVQPSLTAKQRNEERKQRGPSLRRHAAGITAALLDLIPPFAAELRYVRDNLFTTGEVKAGKLDAYIATWTGLGSSTWRGYIRVADILSEVQEQDEKLAEQVSTWTLDSIKVLGPMDEKQRARLVKQAGPNPSEKTVKAIGKRIRPSSTRNTPDAAEKTVKLAEKISEQVTAALMGDRTRFTALVTGAQLAQDHPGQDVAQAILHLSVQPEK